MLNVRFLCAISSLIGSILTPARCFLRCAAMIALSCFAVFETQFSMSQSFLARVVFRHPSEFDRILPIRLTRASQIPICRTTWSAQAFIKDTGRTSKESTKHPRLRQQHPEAPDRDGPRAQLALREDFGQTAIVYDRNRTARREEVLGNKRLDDVPNPANKRHLGLGPHARW